MAKFMNWATDAETGERVLRLEGMICDDNFLAWLYDGVSAKQFRSELNSGEGDITVRIHSEGGDCFAAAAIYTALKEYSGKVTVKIDGLAASAASVVAMAGDVVEISLVGTIMIHNPWTWTQGDSYEMRATAQMLDDVKETIINAYQQKTKLSREEISRLMDDETYFHAEKAIKYGFADKIIGDKEPPTVELSSRRQVMNCIATALKAKVRSDKKAAKDNRVDAAQLHKRLNLLSKKKWRN